jgi:hypothetical protein
MSKVYEIPDSKLLEWEKRKQENQEREQQRQLIQARLDRINKLMMELTRSIKNEAEE